MGTVIFLSIPFIVINFLITDLLLNIYSSITLYEFFSSISVISITDYNIANASWVYSSNFSIFLYILVLIIVHEIFHLLFIPNFLKSNRTYLSFTWYGVNVFTEEKLSKFRFILITIAPFIVISIILPLVFHFVGILTSTIKTIILLNSMASCVDIFTFIILLFQTPMTKKVFLINNGTKTYWKYADIKRG